MADGVSFRPAQVRVIESSDGVLLLRSQDRPAAFDPNIIRAFLANADTQPAKTMYAQRSRNPDGTLGDWARVSFGEARAKVLSVAQWLLARREKGAEDRVLVLSGNSIANAMLRFGAIAAGVPSCAVSVTYAMPGVRYERLQRIVELVKPTMVFVEQAEAFKDALAAIASPGITVVTAASLQDVYAAPSDGDAELRANLHDPDAPIVYQLTSGSTGTPKAVQLSERMICANVYSANHVVDGTAGWDDVLLDWLPWSHVAGAFSLFAAPILGASVYIDDGRPLPGMFQETLRNLAELPLPFYSNVPIGYQLLVAALEQDEALRKTFFSKMRLLLYGGAALSDALAARLKQLARETTGREVMLTSGYGATETAGGCMTISFPTDQVGIGLPLPGVDVKLLPCRGEYEIRVRGECVTSGYLDDETQTKAAFDEDGFFRMGDLVAFHDRAKPELGLKYVGRLAEEFKLASGTWVRASQVRANILAAASPLLVEVVICGEGRDGLGVLMAPNLAALRMIAGDKDASPLALVQNPAVAAALAAKLRGYNEAHPGSSEKITRAAYMQLMPDADSGELTDKGTLNQQAARARRSAEIEALFADPPAAHVLAP